MSADQSNVNQKLDIKMESVELEAVNDDDLGIKHLAGFKVLKKLFILKILKVFRCERYTELVNL